MDTPDTPSPPATAARSRSGASPEPVDPRRYTGRRGEDLAADHMCRLGYCVLARNERTRFGEIDLISFDGHRLVFAEVKTRRVSSTGTRPADQRPFPWPRHRQRARLRRLAVAWLGDEERVRPAAHTIRFDAIGVTIDAHDTLLGIEHLEGAW
jgi:putative endonuclease